jgi:hypothetical protein
LSLTPLGSTEFWLTLVALIGLFSVQAVYWFFTHPVNKFWVEGENLDRFGSGFFAFGSNRSRLGNETHPTDWTRLRDRWEYSHLGRAGLALVSLISLVHRHLGEWLESNRRRLSQDAHPTSGRFAEVPTCSVREECCRAWPGRCCRGWRRSTTRGGSCRSGWQESDAEASLRLLGRLDH